MSDYVIIAPPHLGSGEQGAARKAALEQLAAEAGCYYNGQPSIGKYLVKLADERILKMAQDKALQDAFNRGQQDARNGWDKSDWADVHDLVTAATTAGIPSEEYNATANGIMDAYWNGRKAAG